MKRAETRQDQMQRLATRVAAGDVVFFIGAGFSLESEHNSTEILIVRLIARLEALTEFISNLGGDAAETAKRLGTGLRTTFWLSEKNGDLFNTESHNGEKSIL